MKLIGDPCPERTRIVGRFGQTGEYYPVTGHRGVDFEGHQGTAILAAHEGAVRVGNGGPGYGLFIRLQGFIDGMPLETRYAHLSAVTVEEGAWVRRGQMIGRSGQTGTYVPHLHFELWWQGACVDPLQYMEVEGERQE
jgi:murein DD-endopeptidase MepM/ murein hydrolase activator NlpD